MILSPRKSERSATFRSINAVGKGPEATNTPRAKERGVHAASTLDHPPVNPRPACLLTLKRRKRRAPVAVHSPPQLHGYGFRSLHASSVHGSKARQKVQGIITLLLALGAAQGFTAAPVLEALLPAGGRIGTTVDVKVAGKLGNDPVHYWVSGVGLSIEPGNSNNNFQVVIASNAPAGPCLIRAWNLEGASLPRIFNVGSLPEHLEVEPNDARAQAVKVTALPATYNGRLEKNGDVDGFALDLTAGATLVAAVDAYVLGSPLDAHLHLYDPQGERVAFNHDYQALDPFLAYTAVRSGIHVLQVAGFAHPPRAEIRFAGSSATVYRLTLTDGPFADHLFPTAIKRGERARIEVSGFNLQPPRDTILDIDPTLVSPAARSISLASPGRPHPLSLAVSDHAQVLEQESSDDTPRQVVPPVFIHGCINPSGDVDRFAFPARKGERYEFVLEANRLGLPLDGVLRLEDPAGAELARDDDGGGERDARIAWTAKSDSTNFVQVRDLFGRGGTRFVYRLAIRPPLPGFSVSVSQDSFQVAPGKAAEVKLTVKRQNDHTNALTLSALGLPAGVNLSTNELPLKGGELKLSILADTNAIPTNIPIALVVSETSGGKASQFAEFNLQSSDESRGDYLIRAATNLWLTVKVAKE